MRQRPACDVKPPIVWNEAITQRKYEAINKRSDQKKSVEDQWFAIFSVLFSGFPLPTSVYRDNLQSPQLIKVQEDIYHEWPVIFDSLATEIIPEELRQHAIILGPHLNSVCQNLITSVLRRLEPATGLEYASATSDSGFNSLSRVMNISNPQPIPPQVEPDNSNSFSYMGGAIEEMGDEAIMSLQHWSLFHSNGDFLRSQVDFFNANADSTEEKE
ncbi:hypothetical protein K4F52_001592 [Lecanicillium sp. MT-2017a]|nr:hypothetical protein K4F52_001592 [Lecanicillium sp. MT-2017a]